MVSRDGPATLPPYSTTARNAAISDILAQSPHQDFSVTPEHQTDYILQDSDQTLSSPSITDDVLLELHQQSLLPHLAGLPHSNNSFVDVSDHGGAFEGIQTTVGAKKSTTSWSTPSKGLADWNRGTESQNKAFQEYTFCNLLQQCLKLHLHLRAVEDVQVPDDGGLTTPYRTEIPDSQLQEILGDVEASYKRILEICEKDAVLSKSTSLQATSLPEKASSTLLDPASISLITAVIFKTLQLCNALLSSAEKKTRSITDVLLYKKLDVNITLARIVMSKVEALAQSKLVPWKELSNSIVHIERQFMDKREKIQPNDLYAQT